MKRNLIPVIALFLLALSFTSCKKDKVKGTAYIQIINASETSSPFDFYVNNNKINNTTLQFNQSTEYIAVNSGQQPAAIKIAASGVIAQAFDIDPQPGAYYSIYYSGIATSAYLDDLSAPATGKARVRFINLNEEINSNLDFGITGGAKIVSNLSPFKDSNYYNVDASSSFSVYTTGTTTSLKDITTNIQAGHIYTVYLAGQTTGGLTATVVLQK